MNIDRGWVAVYRKIAEHRYWLKEKFTRGQAWIDLIMLANHKEDEIYVRGIKTTIKRGQLFWSQEALSKRWGWSRQKTIGYIIDLTNHNEIAYKVDNKIGVITVINYDKYQNNGQQTRQQTRQQKNNKPDPNNNVNNDNNINILQITETYRQKISKETKLTDKAKLKLNTRLKEFTLEEILKAIDNFSKDTWQMENNANRGMAWFFDKEDRIESYKNMIPRSTNINLLKGGIKYEELNVNL